MQKILEDGTRLLQIGFGATSYYVQYGACYRASVYRRDWGQQTCLREVVQLPSA